MLRLFFLLAAAFAGFPALAAPSLTAASRPLLIVTNENSEMALEGHFEGTFSVQAGFVEVNLTRASLLYLGSETNQRPRLVTTVRLGLGYDTGNASWGVTDYVPIATLNDTMNVGETRQIPALTVRIPVSDTRVLAKKWFVVEIANKVSDPAKPNVLKSGVCYAQSRRSIFADGPPARGTTTAAAPRISSQPRPLLLISKEDDAFSVEGRFEGTYSIQPGFIEVKLSRASILNLGHLSYREPRLVTRVRISLARITNGRWGSMEYVTFATPNQTLKVGESLQLPESTVHIPLPEGNALSQYWFVAEIASAGPNSAKGNATTVGTCYAHSARNIFASAK